MIAGIDVGAGDRETAEHAGLLLLDVLGGLLPAARAEILATHSVRPEGGSPRVALALVPGGASVGSLWLLDGLVEALRRSAGDGGWAVVATGPGLPDGWSDGRPDLLPGAWAAALSAAARSDGRLVRYPGEERMRGVVTLGDVTQDTAVEDVVAVGAPPDFAAAPDAVLDTRDHVRPQWRSGRVVLHVQPARGGRFVPFEAPHERACCTDHVPRPAHPRK